MDSDRAIERAIETVARLYERSVLSHSPLHLAACGGCGGPSFQQPCPLCNFYPMGSDKGVWHPRTASRQFFCDRVAASASDGAGNLATWVLSASRKTVAYAQSYAFRQRLDGALAEAAHLEMPDPGLIHDRVAGDGMRYGRPSGTYGFWKFWDAARLLEEQGLQGPWGDESRADPLRAAIDEAVAALHDGRLADACGTLRAAALERLDHRYADRQAIRRAINQFDELAPQIAEEEPTAGPRP